MQGTRKQIHEQAYYYILVLLAIFLPLSIYVTSVIMFLLAINWAAEGMFAVKWKRAARNRTLQLFLLLAVIHVAGLLWSDDLAYGLRDVKIKVPLLILPLFIATSAPLQKRQIQWILFFFTLGVFTASTASLFKLAGWLPGEVLDYRDLSIFISHIRFSLMTVLALLIIVYSLFVPGNSVSPAERILYIVGLLWFPLFLVLLKSLSGIVVAGVLLFCFLLRLVFEIRDHAVRFMVFVPVLMIPLFAIIYLGHAVDKFYSFDTLSGEELDTLTVEGNRYSNDLAFREVENGHYVWVHVCDQELEREWSRMSELDYRGRTANGNSLRATLIRFLTSKGLRKDAAGVKQLSDAEIRAIERGTSNCIYLQRFRLYPRIYEVIWEFDRYRMGYPPNDKSVVQRYLYLRAGWSIAKEHPLFGVGNGDVLRAFKQYYDDVASPLVDNQRRGAHNQYLTILVGLGGTGLIISILALVGPLYLAGRQRSFMAVGFLLLLMVAMLGDDTLDSTTGAALTGLFYSLFLFGPDFPWLAPKSGNEDG
jgi:hypothetical protein